jgi:hypothetical protein
MEDREFDALIAVCVMGWRYVRQMDLRDKVENGWLFEPEEAARCLPEYVSESHPRPCYRNTMPHYSTDVSAAMEVLRVFQNKKWMWSLNGSSEGGFWCVLYPPAEADKGLSIETETVDSEAKAICLAALQAAS